MPSPHDRTRTAVFRRWLRTIDDDLDQASAITGIGLRTLQRMRSGSQPPPVRLLDQLATHAAEAGHPDLAGDVAGAAQPMQVPHA